jgi:hypothetical protein
MSEHRRRRRIDDEDEDEDENEESDEEDDDDDDEEEEDENHHFEEEKMKNIDEINLANLEMNQLQQDSDSHPAEVTNKIPPEKLKRRNRSESKKSRNQEKQDDPFIVPRGTRFFLHDDRKAGRSQAKPSQQQKNRKTDEMNWKHDKFDELLETEENSNRSQRNCSEHNSFESETIRSHRAERGGRGGRGRVVSNIRGRGRGRVIPEYQTHSIQESTTNQLPETPPYHQPLPSDPQRLADLYRREGGRTRRGRGRGPSSYDSHMNSYRADPQPPTPIEYPSEDRYRRSGRVEIPGRVSYVQESESPYTSVESETLHEHEQHPAWSWGSENGENPSRVHEYLERRGGGRTRGRGRGPPPRSERDIRFHSAEPYELPSHPRSYPEPDSEDHPASDAPPFQSSTPSDSAPNSTSGPFPPPQQPQVKNSLKLKATAHEFHPSPGPDHHSPSADEYDYHHNTYGSSMDRVSSISPDYHTPGIPVPMYHSPNPEAIPPPLYYPPSYHPHPSYYYPPPPPYQPPHLPYHIPPEMANHHHSYSPHPYDPSQYMSYDSSLTADSIDEPSHQHHQQGYYQSTSAPPHAPHLHHHQGNYYPSQH